MHAKENSAMTKESSCISPRHCEERALATDAAIPSLTTKHCFIKTKIKRNITMRLLRHYIPRNDGRGSLR